MKNANIFYGVRKFVWNFAFLSIKIKNRSNMKKTQ